RLDDRGARGRSRLAGKETLALQEVEAEHPGGDEDAGEQRGPREGDPAAGCTGGGTVRADTREVSGDVVELVCGVLRHGVESIHSCGTATRPVWDELANARCARALALAARARCSRATSMGSCRTAAGVSITAFSN